MGSSIGISHGISKSTGQKTIALMGDGTFFHSGVLGLINAVYNKSNPLLVVMDNRITAMTGHQQNPGMGRTLMGEQTEELKIEEIAKACGVKNVKVLDPVNTKELEETICCNIHRAGFFNLGFCRSAVRCYLVADHPD
jgi:indolepyruvate ferredoxin oxidoreductase alpha subunit